jgi:DNA phosphorothioation-dependent restriction protein DptG
VSSPLYFPLNADLYSDEREVAGVGYSTVSRLEMVSESLNYLFNNIYLLQLMSKDCRLQTLGTGYMKEKELTRAGFTVDG